MEFFVHWLPGIALFLKIYSVIGERIFDNFFVVFLVCILCAGVGLCWVTFSFFVASLVRNITWQRMGYHQCFYIIFPFVYLKGEGFHLISTTLSYHCALFDSLPKDFVESETAKYHMGRWAEPKEIADVIVYLASDKATYITGQIIVLDGGHC